MMNKLVATIGAVIFMLSVSSTAALAQHGTDDHGHRHGGHDTHDRAVSR